MVPVKQEYTILTVLEDKYMFVDLNYEWKQAWGAKATSILAWNTLVSWRDNATPLTMRSRQSLFDNITVALNSILPVPMDSPGPEQKNNMERYVISLSLMDV